MKSILKVTLAAMIVAGLCLAGIPAIAHHSGAEFGGPQKEIIGTIKEFQFKNPHSWIQINVPDPKTGKITEWSLEWGAPNSLGRQGYRPSSLPVGAKVIVHVTPMKNGGPAGSFGGLKFVDTGKTIGNFKDLAAPGAAAPAYGASY